MTNEKLEKIEGIVQSKAEKKIKVNNFIIFFNFNSELLNGIEVGDEVAVSYHDQISKKDGKLYHNGKSIVKYEKELTNVNSDHKLDTSTINTILMISKDIYLVKYSNVITYEDCVKEVLKGFQLIK